MQGSWATMRRGVTVPWRARRAPCLDLRRCQGFWLSRTSGGREIIRRPILRVIAKIATAVIDSRPSGAELFTLPPTIRWVIRHQHDQKKQGRRATGWPPRWTVALWAPRWQDHEPGVWNYQQAR